MTPKINPVSSSNQSNQPDPLLVSADFLVQFAQYTTGEMATQLSERFPILRQVDAESLNFFLTVASVVVAVSRLNILGLDYVRKKQLMVVIFERLDKWKPDGLRGFNDCDQFFDKEFVRITKDGHKPSFAIPVTIGKWIFLNILNRPPQGEEECALVGALGKFVTHAFFDWWDKPLKTSDSSGEGKK